MQVCKKFVARNCAKICGKFHGKNSWQKTMAETCGKNSWQNFVAKISG